MFETSAKSRNVSGGFSCIFDVVIVQLNLINFNPEQGSKPKVDVKFNNKNIKITSSRINVNEFKFESGLKFNESLSALKDSLIQNPLECNVYNDGQLVGNCRFLWPESLVNNIAVEYGREITLSDAADIEKENQKVGRMEILARLQLNCPEFKEAEILQPKLHVCRSDNNVINLINPNDVIFAACDTKCDSIACSDIAVIPDSDSGSSALATCLDLSHLRRIHGKTVKSTDLLNSIGNKCCSKRKCSNRCKEIIKDYFGKSDDQPQSYSKSKQQQLKLYQLQSDLQMKLRDCVSESKFSSGTSSDSCHPFQCVSDENASEGDSIRQIECVTKTQRKRYCPLCHENITWLPKFAACTKCGFRSFSQNIDEKPYDFTLTANDILQQYEDGNVMQQVSDISMKTNQRRSSCRCTCKNGKMCAHCRIKKLCADIYQPFEKPDKECGGKCETNSSDLFNVCRTSSHTCRPYLIKVFDELKNLFDMTEAKKNNLLESNDELKNISNMVEDRKSSGLEVKNLQETNKNKKEKPSKSHHSIEKNADQERKQFLAKNLKEDEACKNKTLHNNNHDHRQYPVSKIGHKTCIAGLKIVPRNMGWLWNVEANGRRIGWMPGAIRKPIKNLMQHFLNKDKLHSSCNWQRQKGSNNVEKDYTTKATLHICKKDGVYFITLRPFKALGSGETASNTKPIQFKITKQSFLLKLRKIKKILKEMGFAKCTCHKPISMCCCRSLMEKKKLEYECCKECKKQKLRNCSDELILSDTTNSEAEFEIGVTPPAAVQQPGPCYKKKKKRSSGTQYEEGDWKITPKYPKPLEKYMKLHNCAVGNRFGKAFGPYGKKGYGPGAAAVDGIYGPDGIIRPTRMRGKDGRGIPLSGPAAFLGPDGKFSMANYLAYKALTQPSKQEIAERKRRKMELLKGVNPPLLCKVVRRRKPLDICSACLPCNLTCLSDDRIC